MKTLLGTLFIVGLMNSAHANGTTTPRELQNNVLTCARTLIENRVDEASIYDVDNMLSKLKEARHEIKLLKALEKECQEKVDGLQITGQVNDQEIDGAVLSEVKNPKVISMLNSGTIQCKAYSLKVYAPSFVLSGVGGELNIGKCETKSGRSFFITMPTVGGYIGAHPIGSVAVGAHEFILSQKKINDIVLGVQMTIGGSLFYGLGVSGSESYGDDLKHTSMFIGIGAGLSSDANAHVPVKLTKIYNDFSKIRNKLGII